MTAGEDMSEFYQLRFATILAKSERNASSFPNGIVRQLSRTMASTTEYERLAEEGFPRQLSQVRQALGTNQSDNSISGRLLQLDMAAQPAQNHCSSTGRISGSTLELARPGHLSHNNLMHYRVDDNYKSQRVEVVNHYRSNIQKLVEESDVIVIPSRWEPFGLVCLEASGLSIFFLWVKTLEPNPGISRCELPID